MKSKFGLSSLLGAYLASRHQTPPSQGILNPFFENTIGKLFGATGGPASKTSLGSLIINVVEILLLVAASIAVIFLIVGGYKYVVSRGNEEAAESAKKTMTSAILGLVIIILSFTIIRIISAILLEGTGALGI